MPVGAEPSHRMEAEQAEPVLEQQELFTFFDITNRKAKGERGQNIKDQVKAESHH